MKAILTFNLPRENEEFRTTVNGMGYRNVLSDVDNYLREKLKYGHKYKSVNEALQDVRDYLISNAEMSGVEI